MGHSNKPGSQAILLHEKLCARFYASFANDHPITIPELVAETEQKLELFAQLFFIELQHDVAHNTLRSEKFYLKNYPQFQTVVQDVFRVASNWSSGATRREIVANPAPGDPDDRLQFGMRIETKLGELQLVEKIGEVRTGVVYLAKNAVTDDMVVIKVIRIQVHRHEYEEYARFDEDLQQQQIEVIKNRARQRYLETFENCSKRRHQNILETLAYGLHGESPYFVMPYIDHSLDLFGYLTTAQPKFSKRIELFKGIVDAIQYAHQNGVIHTNLNPANILVNSVGKPLVAELGLASTINLEILNFATYVPCLPDYGIFQHGRSLRILGFLAPEHFVRKWETTERTDVFSLGAIFYFLLTGEPPFGKSISGIDQFLKELLDCRPVAPRLLAPHLPDDINDICMRCLRLNPADRFSDVKKLNESLDKVIWPDAHSMSEK